MHPDRFTKALLGMIALALTANLFVSLRAPATAQEQPAVGKYQVAAPDLICDTMTGAITNAKGAVIAPAVSPQPKAVGTYQAAGWVTVTAQSVAYDGLGRPQITSQEQRAYATVDTTSGQIAAFKTYATSPVVTGVPALVPPPQPPMGMYR